MFRRLAEEGIDGVQRETQGPLDLIEVTRSAFTEFAHDIKGSLVYLDDGAAEQAHYALGASFLLGLGARNVLPLGGRGKDTTFGNAKNASQNNEPEDVVVDVAGVLVPQDTPVVIFTHMLISKATNDIVNVVSERPSAKTFVVACSASRETHEADARAAARANGASAAAAANAAVDAKAIAARNLSVAVNAIVDRCSAIGAVCDSENDFFTVSESLSGASKSKIIAKDDFEAADEGWGDWGSEDEDVVTKERAAPEILHSPMHRSPTTRLVMKYFPVPFVPLASGAFTLPVDSAGATAKLSKVTVGIDGSTEGSSINSHLSSKSKALQSILPSFEDGTEEDGGDSPSPAGIGVVAETLLAMGEPLGVSKFECFAVGRCARAVARQVAIGSPPTETEFNGEFDHHNPSGMSKQSDSKNKHKRPCALVVVDRVCDLLTPGTCDYFHPGFLPKAVLLGERRKVTNDDISLPFTPCDFEVRQKESEKKENQNIQSGCLSHPNDGAARVWVANAFGKTLHEAATSARRWVLDVLRNEGLPGPNTLTKGKAVTSEELISICSPLQTDPKLRLKHGGMLQNVAVVATALDAEPSSAIVASALRVAIRDASAANAGEGAAAAAIANALVTSLREIKSPADAVSLIFAGYLIAGEACAAERARLQLPPIDFTALDDENDDEGLDAARVRDEISIAQKSPFGGGDESLIRDALVECILSTSGESKSKEMNDWLGGDLGDRILERRHATQGEAYDDVALTLETRDYVEKMLKKLGLVAQARRRYKSAGSVLEFGDSFDSDTAASPTRGVLKELAERVSIGADGKGTNRTDLLSVADDLTHVASSLGGILKSIGGELTGRFGFGGSVQHPKPSDSPLVLFFVLGGVTASEISDVRSAAARVITGGNAFNETCKVRDILIGGTGLLRSGDVLNMVM